MHASLSHTFFRSRNTEHLRAFLESCGRADEPETAIKSSKYWITRVKNLIPRTEGATELNPPGHQNEISCFYEETLDTDTPIQKTILFSPLSD